METIYYISQGITVGDHLKNISMACEAGCRLVQFRLKDIDFETYQKAAIKALEICRTYNATLLINDNVTIAKEIGADGVHIGKSDMNPNDARQIIGNKIIGGTANTLEDCLRLIEQKVNYIGLGPLRYTTTKSELSPILGIDGYKEILGKLRALKKAIPIVAIGGIQAEDFETLFGIGISSVAVSGLLTDKPEHELKTIINQAKIKPLMAFNL